MNKKAQRLERDLLGAVSVPKDRLYGAQTARALMNFGNPPLRYSLGTRSDLIRALLQIKSAASVANEHADFLSSRQRRLIQAACNEALHWRDYTVEFPIHILHGGGGTSANMNVNEVIANLANRRVGRPLGSYDPIQPLDHVNRNQSTNDVYPSGCRLAIAATCHRLLEALRNVILALKTLTDCNRRLPRVARTCLQDAVHTTWGRFFHAQGQALQRCADRIASAGTALCVVNLGGGVAGEPGASPKAFRSAILPALQERMPHLQIRAVTNYADAAQNADDLLVFGHSLDELARTLIKQCSDYRLLASGPECGLGEIALPARQPGSSAMPGKINPVIPEFVIQCSFATVGAVQSCGLAINHADLDLNVWEGIFVDSLMSSTDLLAAALESLATFCLAGLRVNEIVTAGYSKCNTAKATVYARDHSYTEALAKFQKTSEAD